MNKKEKKEKKEVITYKNILELQPYKNNPRFNDEAVPLVKESILNYGFKVPIVIDKNNVIVCGHTRYLASKELGLKSVPCIVADDLTENQIKAFRIADNKCSDFSFWNNNLLLEELKDIGKDLFTGFNFNEFNFNGFVNVNENGEVVNSEDNNVEVCDNNLKSELSTNTDNNCFYVINYKTKNKELYDAILDLINQYENK